MIYIFYLVDLHIYFIAVPSVFSLFWPFLIALGPLRKKIEREVREKEDRERREGGSGDERLRREITLYGGLLQRGRELEFNFRVNLI